MRHNAHMLWKCVLVMPYMRVSNAPIHPPNTPPRLAMEVNTLKRVPSIAGGQIAASRVINGNCATVLTEETNAESVTTKTVSGIPRDTFARVYSSTATTVTTEPITVALKRKLCIALHVRHVGMYKICGMQQHRIHYMPVHSAHMSLRAA